jgi:hypothetical protein
MNTNKQRLATKEEASFTELVEHREAVILDLESLSYYSLNAAATLLWKHLRAGASTTADELSASLTQAFGVGREQATADASAFIVSLKEAGLLTDSIGEVGLTGATPALPPQGTLGGYEAPALKTSSSLMEVSLAVVSGTTPGPP